MGGCGGDVEGVCGADGAPAVGGLGVGDGVEVLEQPARSVITTIDRPKGIALVSLTIVVLGSPDVPSTPTHRPRNRSSAPCRDALASTVQNQFNPGDCCTVMNRISPYE